MTIRAACLRVIYGVRDAWIIIGITLLLAVAADGAVRIALDIHDRLHDADQIAARSIHPYAGQAWFEEWERRGWPESLPRSYDALRAWKMGFVSVTGIHVDTSGERLTVTPSGSATNRQVLLMGGSVIWGYTARDSMTIPSLVAEKLAAAHVDVRVRNLAQPGFILSQDVAALLIELRAGRRPISVVFLDGVNDVGSAAEWGEAGHVYFERDLEQRFRATGGVISQIARGLARTTAIGEVFGVRLARLKRANTPVPATVCADVAKQYWNQVRTVHALAEAYGFSTLFMWQPALAITSKQLTPFERAIQKDHPVSTLLVPCTAAVEDSAVQHPDFISLKTLFDKDTTTVFLDQWGHVTERSNDALATVIADRLTATLSSQHAPSH